MNNIELFNFLYGLKNNNKTTIKDGVLFDGGKSTQADKPSPHSSFTTTELWKRIRKGFPEDNIKVFEVANTNSMEPLFDDNSQVICETINDEVVKKQALVPGDIVVYSYGGNLIIHRLMESQDLGGKHWLIKGDNNYLPDGWVPETAIKYRYVGALCGRQNRIND
jgi:hypothetical protein